MKAVSTEYNFLNPTCQHELQPFLVLETESMFRQYKTVLTWRAPAAFNHYIV